MDKKDFPSEQAILKFFQDGGKGTKKEIAEALSITPNEGPTKRWRDKLDSILRRLRRRGILDRQRVQKGSRQLYEYCLHQRSTVDVQEVEPANEGEVNNNDVKN